MAELAQYLTSTQRERLVELAASLQRGDRTCACGKPKSTKHLTCPSCSRHVGPYVVVQSPSGDYVEVGGLESAESLLNREQSKPVQI